MALEKICTLEISNLALNIANNKILNNISFCLPDGEIGCLLGPSASGKTSTLRAIAGFIPEISNGKIVINGKIISDQKSQIPPSKRNIGFVFQENSLFPHLTVSQNICFGVKQYKKMRLNYLLEIFEIEKIAKKYPHEISGGQQQRVAIARSIAPNPDLLLLDEPFSDLDPELKFKIFPLLKEILNKEHITTLIVTHDQMEAYYLADLIGVLNKGELQQWGSPSEIYKKPKNKMVASFIGDGSILPAIVTCVRGPTTTVSTPIGFISGASVTLHPESKKTHILIRPEDIFFDKNSDIKAKIVNKIFCGSSNQYLLKVTESDFIKIHSPSNVNYKMGETVGISHNFKHIVLTD